ncbi:MAG: PKD domain-containing protein [Candidatus Thermoplasmatota archaeon]
MFCLSIITPLQPWDSAEASAPQVQTLSPGSWNDTFEDTTKIEFMKNLTVEGGDVKLSESAPDSVMPSWATVYFIDVANQSIDLDALKTQLTTDGIPYTDNTTTCGMPTFDGTKVYLHQVNRHLSFTKQTSIIFANHSVYVSSSEVVIAFSDDFAAPNNQNLFMEDIAYYTYKMSTSTTRVSGFTYGSGGPSPAYVLDETLNYIYTYSAGAVTQRSTFASILLATNGYMLQAVTNDYGTAIAGSNSWVHFDFTTVPGQSSTVVKAWLRGRAANGYYDLEYPEGTYYNTFVDKNVTAETQIDSTPRLRTQDPSQWNHAAGGAVVIIGESTTLPTEIHSFTDQASYDWADELFITSLKKVETIENFGNLTSTAIELPSGQMWSSLNITKTEPSAENNITVSILNGSTGTPIPGYTDISSTDVNISGIDRALYPSIKLLANFSGNGSATPILHEWGVNWTWDGKTPLINHTAVTSAPLGSVINITVNVTDPGGVNAVTLCYKDVGAGSYTSVPMALISGDNTNGDWSADIPPQVAVGTAYYYINATDGTYNSSHPAGDAYLNPHAIAIYDGTAPEISHTPPSVVNTSEAVDIVASVTDNVAVSGVNISYYFNTTGGFTPAQNKSMNDQGGGNYNYTISVPDNALSLHYNISAKDAANNWNDTGDIVISVVDTLLPSITDTTAGSPPVNASFTITAIVMDNIGVYGVWVYYFFNTTTGQTSPLNVSMIDMGSGNYERTVSVPSNGLVLYYNISANDTSNHWVETGEYNLSAIDPPPGITDTTSALPSTGDPFEIRAEVSDNVAMGDVRLWYYFETMSGNTSVQNVSMTYQGGGLYNWTVDCPIDGLVLHYNISANDTSDNWNETGEVLLVVVDDDLPGVVDMTAGTPATGASFDIVAAVTDNIGIKGVYLYSYFDTVSGPTSPQYTAMSDIGGGLYNYTVVVPVNGLALHYNISANDTSGNWNKTGEIVVGVMDILRPSVTDATVGSPVVNTTFTLTAYIADNIAVSEVRLWYYFNTTTGNTTAQTVPMNDLGGGAYEYLVLVPINAQVLYYNISGVDTSDNWNETGVLTLDAIDIPPEIYDLSTASPLINCSFEIMARVIDNIEVSDALLYYYFTTTTGDTPIQNAQMNPLGGGDYNCTITIPADALILYYNISANDSNDNRNDSGTISLPTMDMPPEVVDTTAGTPITGANFAVNAWVRDNVGVSETYLYYYFDTTTGSTTPQDVVMNYLGSGNYTYPVSVPLNALVFYYNISASDTSDNWNETGANNLGVADGICPEILDTTAGTPEIGVTFTINATVTDNIVVGQVRLYYYFSTPVGLTTYVSVGMNAVGNDYFRTLSVPDNAIQLYYNISAADSTSWNETGLKSLAIKDPIVPTAQDITSGTPTTGDSFTVTALASDNVAVGGVCLRYQFQTPVGLTPYTNVTMTSIGSDNYNWALSVPINALQLTYSIGVRDFWGNWAETPLGSRTVKDNDPPGVTIADGAMPSTGSYFTIAADVLDNINPRNVHLIYYFETTTGPTEMTNVTMSHAGSGTYNCAIPTPINAQALHYIIAVNDTSNNWNNTPTIDVNVRDSIIPRVADLTDDMPTTGDELTIRASGSDNIGVDEVWLIYWLGTGDVINVTMTPGASSVYSIQIAIPHTVAPLQYKLAVADEGNNWNSTSTRTVEVLDNDLPVAVALGDEEAAVGALVSFDARDSKDNVGIVNYTWSFVYEGVEARLYGTTPSFRFQKAGIYRVTLNVSDAAGNWDTDTAVVVVTAQSGSDQGDGWITEFWWIPLIFAVVLLVIGLLAARHRRRKAPSAQDRSWAPPSTSAPGHSDKITPEERPIPQSSQNDELLRQLDKRFAEGRISEQTYQMLRKKYGG